MAEISIIIPVYNHIDITIQCLNSIKKHCSHINYEIIVVNDCSSDQTHEFLSNKKDIVYVRNSENRGFAYSCNRGAEKAKGEYLLFLNNDTILTDNILTKIKNTFKKKNDIGIVGAKLLYEDDTIQHAGVLIYPNKKVGHLFKNFPANYPAANQLRELQCVTGACLTIPKRLFFEVGKFDERFINGYEDLDLCFKVREKGYKVIYNPSISLYHYEEKTRNTKKRIFEEKNTKLMCIKWLKKIHPDFFLLEEGYDFKINDIGEFYLIKNDFNHINSSNLFSAIEIEPLYFYGYKRLISTLLDEKKYNFAEIVCLRLIQFEPIIDNYYILKSIYLLKGEKDKANYIENLINKLKNAQERIKPLMRKILESLLIENQKQIARYYEEWIKRYDI